MFKLKSSSQFCFRFHRLYSKPNYPNEPKKPVINPKFELPKKPLSKLPENENEQAPEEPKPEQKLSEQEKIIQATVRQIQESIKLKQKYGIVGIYFNCINSFIYFIYLFVSILFLRALIDIRQTSRELRTQ